MLRFIQYPCFELDAISQGDTDPDLDSASFPNGRPRVRAVWIHAPSGHRAGNIQKCPRRVCSDIDYFKAELVAELMCSVCIAHLCIDLSSVSDDQTRCYSRGTMRAHLYIDLSSVSEANSYTCVSISHRCLMIRHNVTRVAR